jgi:hypothetical protein
MTHGEIDDQSKNVVQGLTNGHVMRDGAYPTLSHLLTQFMQSKSVTAMKSFNDGHFLDFYFHRMDDTPSNKNLARAPVILGFHHFTTIRTA